MLTITYSIKSQITFVKRESIDMFVAYAKSQGGIDITITDDNGTEITP